jgi:glycosyltransferase involved in cell wall biosynthesis
MAEHSRLDIQVAYCSLQGVEAGIDPDFGIPVKWDIPLLDGYPWVQVPNRSPWPGLQRFFGLVNPGLWKLVSTGGYDAVVVYTGYAYLSFWIALAAAKLHAIPILFGTDATSIEPRNGSRWKVWIKKRVLPVVFRRATVAIAPSAATAEYLRSLGVAKERVVVTPFAVDNEYWTSRAAQVDREAVRASWGVSNGEPVVLFCAKLQPWKRPQDVLRAFSQAGVPDAHLVMAGDGPMLAELQSAAKTLGCSERVRFVGFTNQTELPALYRSADVMVLASEYDPCPVVVCEAMLCGCPVILSDRIRGRAELIRPAETGYFYSCGDVDALAALLRDVLSHRERLKGMGEAARLRMETWSPRENIEAHLEGFERAVHFMRHRAAA